ncbi:helix-turn-helix domain-containing protein [Paenibacillus cellulositrophicus]|uniref:helix-turn-helix domain-containing protein n=1 Tax=Paenibacillus cellulositrophicus TaxID=562959 RepID=UPI003F806E1B
MAKKSANKKTLELEFQMDKLRENHQSWKKKNHANRVGFFPIFNDFKYTHLSEISGGALKAYIYFGVHANNNTGECWHSAEKMGQYFGVDIRTIKKWIAELEERNLIERIQVGYHRVANTFLIPYEAAEDVFTE